MHRAQTFPGAACFHAFSPHQSRGEPCEGSGTHAKAAPLQVLGDVTSRGRATYRGRRREDALDHNKRQANKTQNRTTGHSSLGGCQLRRAASRRGTDRSQTPNWVRVSSACTSVPSLFQSSEPLLATYSKGNRYLAARRRRAKRDWSRSSLESSNQLTSDRTSCRFTDDKSVTPRRDQMSGT